MMLVGAVHSQAAVPLVLIRQLQMPREFKAMRELDHMGDSVRRPQPAWRLALCPQLGAT